MTDYTETQNYLDLAAQSNDQWFKDRALRRASEELTSARDEAERFRERVAELESALLDSQDWNWITAHEEMIDNCVTDYPIDEMQRLHLVAMGNTSDAWILRKQAEAVEEAYKSTVLSTKGDHPQYEKGFDDAMNQYDRQMEKYVELLRQQAESIENGE